LGAAVAQVHNRQREAFERPFQGPPVHVCLTDRQLRDRLEAEIDDPDFACAARLVCAAGHSIISNISEAQKDSRCVFGAVQIIYFTFVS
jgi:hypothetical protein